MNIQEIQREPDVPELTEKAIAIISQLCFRENDPNVTFLTEEASTNTRDNVVCALNVVDFSKFPKITFAFKAHAAGRGLLTLRHHLPKTQIFQAAYPTSYKGVEGNLEVTNWTQTPTGIMRVWGELKRIKLYGERGDIYYGDEIRAQMEILEKEIGKF